MQKHILILDCDTPVPAVAAVYPTYSAMFAALFNRTVPGLFTQYPDLPAQLKTQTPRAQVDDGGKRWAEGKDFKLEFKFSAFDAVGGHLPTREELSDGVDGVVITGSASSAYDPDPWIQNLTTWIKDTYTHHPRIKLFGSCFGHQIIAHALFPTPTPSPPSIVSPHPSGHELGIHPITLSPPFLSFTGPVLSNPSSPSKCRLQFIHGDHVTPPLPLPSGWIHVGATPHCSNQGLYLPGRVLTLQGHAEFDEFVNRETVRVFGGRLWGHEGDGGAKRIGEAEMLMREGGDGKEEGRAVDDLWAAGVILKFLVGGGEAEGPVREGNGMMAEGVVLESEIGEKGRMRSAVCETTAAAAAVSDELGEERMASEAVAVGVM